MRALLLSADLGTQPAPTGVLNCSLPSEQSGVSETAIPLGGGSGFSLTQHSCVASGAFSRLQTTASIRVAVKMSPELITRSRRGKLSSANANIWGKRPNPASAESSAMLALPRSTNPGPHLAALASG